MSSVAVLSQHQEPSLLDSINNLRSSWGESLKCMFIPGYQTEQVRVIADIVKQRLEQGCDDRQRADLLEAGNLCIDRYVGSRGLGKILTVFDTFLAQHRNADDQIFHTKTNQTLFQKRMAYEIIDSHNQRIFIDHPEFCEFMTKANLFSQMKVTRDQIGFVGDEPAIYVDGQSSVGPDSDGKWMPSSELMETFEILHAPLYNQKFLVHKQTRQVYTYLDNGRGLQEYHPFQTGKRAISTLSPHEYETVLARAQAFPRPRDPDQRLFANLDADLGDIELDQMPCDIEREVQEEDRTFILQLVTSFVPGADNKANNLLRKSKHPYIRIIIGKDNEDLGTKKGEVYEVGFGWPPPPMVPFASVQGQFSSPDTWE